MLRTNKFKVKLWLGNTKLLDWYCHNGRPGFKPTFLEFKSSISHKGPISKSSLSSQGMSPSSSPDENRKTLFHYAGCSAFASFFQASSWWLVKANFITLSDGYFDNLKKVVSNLFWRRTFIFRNKTIVGRSRVAKNIWDKSQKTKKLLRPTRVPRYEVCLWWFTLFPYVS